MLERRTMIGGVIGPNDTEFMGYPIVNSVEGPLRDITPTNCTEGCITRCLVYEADYNVILVAYILLLNDTMYLLDSSYVIAYTDTESMMFMLNVKSMSSSSSQVVEAYHSFFPNTVQ